MKLLIFLAFTVLIVSLIALFMLAVVYSIAAVVVIVSAIIFGTYFLVNKLLRKSSLKLWLLLQQFI